MSSSQGTSFNFPKSPSYGKGKSRKGFVFQNDNKGRSKSPRDGARCINKDFNKSSGKNNVHLFQIGLNLSKQLKEQSHVSIFKTTGRLDENMRKYIKMNFEERMLNENVLKGYLDKLVSEKRSEHLQLIVCDGYLEYLKY